MSWIKVGETTFNIQDDGSNHDVNLPGTPQEGDIVIYAHSSDGVVSPGVQTSGYTDLLTDHGDSTPGHESGYKMLGATPDTAVTFNQGSGNEYTAGVLQVWRGADPTTPIDNTPTSATGSSGMPNPPSYDTITDGALVIAIGFLDDDNIASGSSAPSGYSNHLANDNSGNADNASTLIASMEKALAGTENPAAFGGSGSDDWAAVTFALRPAPAGASGVLPMAQDHYFRQRN